MITVDVVLRTIEPPRGNHNARRKGKNKWGLPLLESADGCAKLVQVDGLQGGRPRRRRRIGIRRQSPARGLIRLVQRRPQLRHVDRQRARFIIVDREAILAFLIQDERTIRGEGETALWTNSPDFVKAHRDFFEKAWAAAVPARRRLAALHPH